MKAPRSGGVRVSTITESVEEIVGIAAASTGVDVVDVPVGREVDTMPEVRSEGGTVIVPVVEEVAVVVRRLVLREEIHIKRRRMESLRSRPDPDRILRSDQIHGLRLDVIEQRDERMRRPP